MADKIATPTQAAAILKNWPKYATAETAAKAVVHGPPVAGVGRDGKPTMQQKFRLPDGEGRGGTIVCLDVDVA